MDNISTTVVDGSLFVNIWEFYGALVNQMDDIPEDGAIYKRHLFHGLRDYIARLQNLSDKDNS